MNQLEAMRIYVRVAELASFTEAAQSLGVPKASASTAVQQLETRLGTRLLHRTTRRVQMTQDGRVFYERCRDLLTDMEELNTLFQVGQTELEGRLRVDVPLGVARSIVVPRLPEFLRTHPKLEIELSSTDRRVDPVREGFDCVLRVGTLSDSSLIARPLGMYRIVNCVSADYIAAFGKPRTPDDLQAHRLIHYASTFGAKSAGFEYVGADGQINFVPMPGALTVNNSEAYQAACLAGLGLIQAPEVGMRALLESGRLVEVLPKYRAESMPVSLLYANRRQLPKRVQVFMTWIAEVMQPHLQT
jgi:DNA-binding transcriptional LysR family regulator